jgi:hypothetical protein
MAELNPLGIWKSSEPRPKKAEPQKRLTSSASADPRKLAGGRLSQDSADSVLASGAALMFPFASNQFTTDYKLSVQNLEGYSVTKMMEILATYSPDISRALWDLQRLYNPGWELKALRPNSDEVDDVAQGALDAFIDRLTDLHGSADVVFNRLPMAAFIRGSMLAELVLDPAGREPVDLATPDPATITFRKVPDPVLGTKWQMGQWQGGEFVVLDSPTIRYVAVDPLPGEPYGRALASPALFTSLFLLGMLHDLRRVVAQQGWPRLDLAVNTEKLMAAMPGTTSNDPTKFIEWANQVISEVQSVYDELEPDDAYVHTDIVEVNSPKGAVDSFSLSGLEGLVRILERMAIRALKTMPLMFGTTEGSSEANANRQWEIYAAGIKALQHLGEQLLERLFALALRAQGLEADVEFRFAEMRNAELLRDEQYRALKIDNAVKEYQAGWTSQDEAAQRGADLQSADQEEPRQQAPPSTSGKTQAMNAQAEPGAERMRRRAVQISPNGSNEPLPPLGEVDFTDSDVQRAVEEFDRQMPEDLRGLLSADVTGRGEY